MTDMLSRTIGRYQIGELIGEGAMAKVYRAYDPQMNRRVAMKVLKESFCQDEEYVGRFMREAKAAKALHHPNIATVYDLGTVDNTPYTMQEFPEGRDLGDFLKAAGKLPVEKALIIGIQLCEALDYLHKSGVVHRDIKPENIVVLADGISIKIAGFGVARIDETENAQKAWAGSVPDTLRNKSTGQGSGDTVDGFADLFAVGLILHEMLTGEKAFDAATPGTQMSQHRQQASTPNGGILPDVPAGVRQIVQKLLRENSDNRYRTGAEVVQDLTRELNALRERGKRHDRQKYIPLKARWSLSMVLVVAAVMAIGGSVVVGKLSEAMTAQAVDSGASFARFVATEMANPLLGEEWILVDAFVTEAASRDTFSYLTVIDDAGIVRGSSDKKQLGERYEPDSRESLISENDGIRTTSTELADGSLVFNITAPVSFQDTPVGSIVLGVSQDRLRDVTAAAAWLMLFLAAVTIASVAVVLFIVGGRVGKSIEHVSKSMGRLGAGDMDVRIPQTRNDEVGGLFQAFNAMAAALQGRVPVENGRPGAANHTGSAPSLKITAASPAVASRQIFIHGDAIKQRWYSALSGTRVFLQSNIAALRGKTSALTARLLLLMQQSIATRLEKLEAGRTSGTTEQAVSATNGEAVAPASDSTDDRETGETPAAEVPAQEHNAGKIEQVVAAEDRQIDPNQPASGAESGIPVSQVQAQKLDSAEQQDAQQRPNRDCEGAVARAVAKHEASTAELRAAELEIEQQKADKRASPTQECEESEEIAGAEKRSVRPCQAADVGEASEQSATATPGSGSDATPGSRPIGADPRDSTILLASLPPKHPKQ